MLVGCILRRPWAGALLPRLLDWQLLWYYLCNVFLSLWSACSRRVRTVPVLCSPRAQLLAQCLASSKEHSQYVEWIYEWSYTNFWWPCEIGIINSPFYRLINWVSKKSSNLFKATWPVINWDSTSPGLSNLFMLEPGGTHFFDSKTERRNPFFQGSRNNSCSAFFLDKVSYSLTILCPTRSRSSQVRRTVANTSAE